MPSTCLKSLISRATPDCLRATWQWIERSPLGNRLAKGAMWSLVGTASSRSLTLISSVLVARMIGKNGMGELGIIQSTVGIFSAFAGLGMGLTATKYIAQYRENVPEQAGTMLRLSALVTWSGGMLMTVVLFVLAPWFARHTLAAPHLAGLLRLGAPLLIFGAVSAAQTGALAGFEAFRTIARVNLLAGVLSFPLLLGGAWWFGLKGAVWGIVATQALSCLINHRALRREARRAGVPLSGRLCPEDWTILWRFSLPTTLCALLYGPVNWGCNAILVNRPRGYAEMGAFNATMPWFNVVGFLPGLLNQVLLPLLATETARSDAAQVRKLALLGVKTNSISAVPAALLIAALSPFIMSLYGAAFAEDWPTLLVTVLTAAVVAVHGPAAQLLIAEGRVWPYFAMYFGWALIYLASAFLFVTHGSLGLASARLLAYVVSSAAVLGYAFWDFGSPAPVTANKSSGARPGVAITR